MEKHALLIANSASMIDHFNKDNIRILQDMGYTISVAANFQEGNSSTVERIHAFASELAAQDIEIIDLPIPRKITELGKAEPPLPDRAYTNTIWRCRRSTCRDEIP